MISIVLTVLAFSAPELKRVAVVVGSNGAPAGRQQLRFAHHDAEQMADVLRGVGGFATDDVFLLRDPMPDELLRTLERAAVRAQPAGGGETLFVFYYSGHADTATLYPHGQALSMEHVKQRLEGSRATVRVGVLDACRGGGWTGAKSLVPDAPFEVPVALGLRSRGSVFLASSSGLEDAHESEALKGSFFTHYLVAGMRGAADASGDGAVTLGEAYRYAQALTVRDTAIAAAQPQHPSYEMHLQGRDDLTISEVRDAPSSMILEQEQGPLEVVHLGSGVIVLEVPAGTRSVRAALAPGRYLVRMRTGAGTLARTVELTAGLSVIIREADLRLVASKALAQKSAEPAPLRIDFPAAEPPIARPKRPIGRLGHASVSLGIVQTTDINGPYDRGIVFNAGMLGQPLNVVVGMHAAAHLRPTERLTLAVGTLAAAYRFGDEGKIEVSLAGGLWQLGFGQPSSHPADTGGSVYAVSGLSVDVRPWLIGTRLALVAGGGAQNITTIAPMRAPGPGEVFRFRGTDTWQVGGYVGVHLRLSRVQLSLTAFARGNPVYEGHVPRFELEREWAVGLGGGMFGLAALPVVRVIFGPRFFLDINGEIVLRGRVDGASPIGGRGLIGFTVLL